MNSWIANNQPSTYPINPLAAAIALILAGPGLANAALYDVTNTNDAGPGSLRQAITDANANSGNDDILFAPNLKGTINLSSGEYKISDSVTLWGGLDITINGGGKSNIFVIDNSAAVDKIEFGIYYLTLTNAITAISADVDFIEAEVYVIASEITGSAEQGIKISSYFEKSDLYVASSVISGSGSHGVTVKGNPYSSDRVEIDNSKILDNAGAGIDNNGGTAVISDSEISGNAWGLLGGADWNYLGSSFLIYNSVIANNDSYGAILGHSSSLTLNESSVTGNGKSGVFASNLFVNSTIRASTISGNGEGGVDFGIRYNELTIVDSTISGNNNGPGVSFDSYGGEASITNSTITNNEFGGVTATDMDSEFSVVNSILAGNDRADLAGDATYTVQHSLIQNPADAIIVQSQPGSNIFNQDPLLRPLHNYGGPTQTHALYPDSPAINQGNETLCGTHDQRNIPRLGICDMGAFEFRGGGGAMGDYVWRDDDGDGVQDPGEPGLAGVTVNLRIDCDPSSLLTTTTDSKGAYRFDGLTSGYYQLEFVKPNGYTFSPKFAAGDYHIDSNADPATGLDQCRQVNGGQERRALDAGLVPRSPRGVGGMIGNYVWRDDNGDGFQDPSEPGLEGVTVKLRVDCNTETVLSTTTDESGAYRFSGLVPGHYQLEFIKPDGYEFSPPIAAGNYRKDSNADPQTGLDRCRSIKEGQRRLALDAGVVP